MRELISFDDVIIIPRLSNIESRDDIDISSYLNIGWSGKKIKLRLPIVSSPMDTVTESEMLYRMWINGGIGILHRYCSIEQQNQFIKETKSKVIEGYYTIPSDFIFGAAIGAVGDYIERAQMLIEEGVNLICIDVANGYNKNVVFATEKLISYVNVSNVHLMVGNIGDGNAFKYLADTNMYNSIRCGIGSGAVCSTFVQTGCGYPTLQSVIDAKSKNISNVQICADGGIRYPGDIVKSLALGADFVMLGSMLAGTKASPGDRFLDKDGRESKQYRGMASFDAQRSRGQTNPRVEGISTTIPYKGKIENILIDIKHGIQSGCSYNGASSLEELRSDVQIAKLTNAAFIQGTPHILRGR